MSQTISLYVYTTLGVLVSHDDGQSGSMASFQSTFNTGTTSANTISAAYLDGKVYLTNRTNAGGLVYNLWVSSDNGATFSAVASATAVLSGHNLSLGQIAVQGNSMYVATNGGLLVSNDGTQTFTLKTSAQGLPNAANIINSVYVFNDELYVASGWQDANTPSLSISRDHAQTFANSQVGALYGQTASMSTLNGNIYATYPGSTNVAYPVALAVSYNGGTAFNAIAFQMTP